MHILVENCNYLMRNLGDAAMLQVCVSRIRRAYPQAVVSVLTDAPSQLAAFCPDTRPLTPPARDRKALVGLFVHPRFPNQKLLRWLLAKVYSSSWLSRVYAYLYARCRYGIHAYRYLRAIAQSDLVVSAGGGLINDSFPGLAANLLATFAIAQAQGKKTALFGQGVGPLETQELSKNAAHVISRLSLISIREGLYGMPALERLGIPADRIRITGDDAIEPAFACRGPDIGTKLGVNLRVANYSQMGVREVGIFREAIQAAAMRLSASIVPVPIAFAAGESDIESLKTIFPEFDDLNGDSYAVPSDLYRAISECRVVVTGSYHSGVFALSQGIPVVAVYFSEYYRNKLAGLADQFGVGCTVLDVSQQQASERLQDAIIGSWDSAPAIKNSILSIAKRQIAESQAAYDFVFQ